MKNLIILDEKMLAELLVQARKELNESWKKLDRSQESWAVASARVAASKEANWKDYIKTFDKCLYNLRTHSIAI